MKEVEATLIICSQDPSLLAREISSLTEVAGYPLLHAPAQNIDDFYFDTPDRALEENKLSLRLRQSGFLHLLTFKGPPRPLGAGVVERLEIEEPWSREVLTRVVQELNDRDIKTRQLPQQLPGGHPLETMPHLNLVGIQHRTNHRTVRHVAAPGDPSGAPLAELAIDSVVYHLAQQQVGHNEVEIEAKLHEGEKVLHQISKALLADFAPALRPWEHGKLRTGKAVEELLNQGLLQSLLGADHFLKPAAYDKIDQMLGYGV